MSRIQHAAHWLRAWKNQKPVSQTWIKRGGWLGENLPSKFPFAPQKGKIEYLAAETEDLGEFDVDPVYETAGYRYDVDIPRKRSSQCVRTAPELGDFYAWLLQAKRPEVVVEFGSAFGISGMYLLAGIEAAWKGYLFSFEINPEWHRIAKRNMEQIAGIDGPFTAINRKFEDHISNLSCAGDPIDICLIDAVHTSAFLLPQFDLVCSLSRSGSIILLDDIDFSDDMRSAWRTICVDSRIAAAVELRDGHLGVVELT